MLRVPSNATGSTTPLDAHALADCHRSIPTLDLATSQSAKIASHLLQILRLADLPDEARDSLLAKSILARDYATDACGGATRNVMRVAQARAGGILGHDPWQARDDLHNLISGRHYIAIAHDVGPQARVKLLLNRPRAFRQTLALWEEHLGESEIGEGTISRLFDSPNARLILGPHVRYTPRPLSAGPLYHERQPGMDCGLHAINALAGEQVISKAQFQQDMIRRVLDTYGDTGLTEDDFYLNQPRNPELALLYELENGAQPDVVVQLMRALLPGEIDCSPFGADRNTLLTLAQDWHTKKSGIIVLNQNHYVTFRRVLNKRLGQLQWVLINSAAPKQALTTPLSFLQREPRVDQCVLMGWSAPRKKTDSASCVLQ